MLVLKMMSGQNAADTNTSKGFTLVHLPDRVSISFSHDENGLPQIQVVDTDGEREFFSPGGNTYVMENGKTVASFAHMPLPNK